MFCVVVTLFFLPEQDEKKRGQMGAGILPATIVDGEVWFLFGKEGKFEDSAPGFSDFGGGTDHDEAFLETAVREAGEELTGFLGSDADVRRLMSAHGVYPIDYKADGHEVYRMHICPCPYNEWLPLFYNRNQRFLQAHLPEAVFRRTKLFEKAEIRWVPLSRLRAMRPQFRSYFQHIVDLMLAQADEITAFLRRAKYPAPVRVQSHASTRRRRRPRAKRTRQRRS